ncbi:hypothetical protein MCOR27_005168 [Pyricularia oryzae]|nr:hypothetical protein MCOR01_000677 [Pyricularia oryzae]KAI6262807.1 hypothetical protein MCOR19_000974 [Pyricularia oryzae]KAI6279410.1 hypothetical protein MCOR27_005168 [Pyricularia oryzae]KAI6315250.1 hypothetical protein MCOR34_004728 [Pyricularia oryzae]KAI6315270.1 hypothetical protein MCOR29_007022 [Pyricularia oryzae]
MLAFSTLSRDAIAIVTASLGVSVAKTCTLVNKGLKSKRHHGVSPKINNSDWVRQVQDASLDTYLGIIIQARLKMPGSSMTSDGKSRRLGYERRQFRNNPRPHRT